MDGPGHIFTVSEITSEIKRILENRFDLIWITGEVSNFSAPVSGHFYFTLKDDRAQVRCVMFRGQNRTLRFRPENGMEVTGMGRIGLYEPRGTYQVIFEILEPKGLGALQKAFEIRARVKNTVYVLDQDIGVRLQASFGVATFR